MSVCVMYDLRTLFTPHFIKQCSRDSPNAEPESFSAFKIQISDFIQYILINLNLILVSLLCLSFSISLSPGD